MAYTPNREELAGAAGFFNGEGSVFSVHRGAKHRATPLYYPQVDVGQSGENGDELLIRFQHAVGTLGILSGPRAPSHTQRLVTWSWKANGFEKTQAIAAMLWPWLSSAKKASFKKTLLDYRDARRKS